MLFCAGAPNAVAMLDAQKTLKLEALRRLRTALHAESESSDVSPDTQNRAKAQLLVVNQEIKALEDPRQSSG